MPKKNKGDALITSIGKISTSRMYKRPLIIAANTSVAYEPL